MASYTKILRQIWNDKPNEQATLITELSPRELKLRRTNEKRIGYFNTLGRAKIQIIEDDRSQSIRYVFLSATYERVKLTGNDPVFMAVFLMAIKKIHNCADYTSALDFYHNLMNLPYRKSKTTINAIILGLPKEVSRLL